MIYNSKTPQLGALWGGCLSFSKCHAERNVPVDPHMPWLWDGEEFLRSAIVWTHGYDIYSPSEDGSVIYHNYTKNPIQRGWESWEDPEVQKQVIAMTDNRYRLLVGVDFKGMVDTTELAKYGWGGVRSYEQYKAFSGISLEQGQEDNSSCKQLHWVPYANATEVEATVGGGWKLHATLSAFNRQIQEEEAQNFGELVDAKAAAQAVVLARKSMGIGKQNTDQAIAQLRQEVRRFATCVSRLTIQGCFLPARSCGHVLYGRTAARVFSGAGFAP
ncbi:hypothetical protein BBJ28_00014267 [Nothophytophthora sp. Chile5]|nr:hypothetical protein BBJ28_00014267 [Nothophytophthora sp. Chile5]